MKWEYNQSEYGGSMNIGNELLLISSIFVEIGGV